jgi:hypothetical protein
LTSWNQQTNLLHVFDLRVQSDKLTENVQGHFGDRLTQNIQGYFGDRLTENVQGYFGDRLTENVQGYFGDRLTENIQGYFGGAAPDGVGGLADDGVLVVLARYMWDVYITPGLSPDRVTIPQPPTVTIVHIVTLQFLYRTRIIKTLFQSHIQTQSLQLLIMVGMYNKSWK